MLRSLTLAASFAAFTGTILSAQHTTLTVLHGIPGLPAPVEVVANGASLFSFDFEDIRGPFELTAGIYDIEVRLQGTTVLQATVDLLEGENYSAIAHLTDAGANTLSLFTNDISPIADGDTRITARHTAFAGAVDIALDQNGANFATIPNLTNPNEAVADIPSGMYGVSILAAGTTTSVLGPVPLMLQEDVSYLVFAVGDASGTSFTVLLQTIDFTPGYDLSVSGTSCGTGTISASSTTAASEVPFNVFLSGATPDESALFIWGIDNTTLDGTPLPFDLTPLGAPGCFLYNDALFSAPFVTNGLGLASIALTLPADSGLQIADLYFQWGYTSTNNPLGLEFTESLDLIRR